MKNTTQTVKRGDFKVLVNYRRNGVSVSRSLYTGPHKKHAEKAFFEACVLGLHGILTDCTVRFFDGFKLRKGPTYGEKVFPVPASEPSEPTKRPDGTFEHLSEDADAISPEIQ